MTLGSRIRGALKPEYLYQPRVLVRRLFYPRLLAGTHTFSIPGGARLSADVAEEHGRILATLGVIDLPVTEALWRLVEPGEVCLDVGANIGYMTAILGARVRTGTVHSFEALPSVFEELEANVRDFRRTFPAAMFHPHAIALSDGAGTVKMTLPNGFDNNRGTARVGHDGSIEVPSSTLDELLGNAEVGVMKLDVEGHEQSVLRGAEKLFREHRVRDVVFEEHRPLPTDVTAWFARHGYTVFRLLRPTTGPRLGDIEQVTTLANWLPTNLLATCEEKRAARAFKPRGWQSLR